MMWLYLRMGICVHDAYRAVDAIRNHKLRTLQVPESPGNFATSLAHGLSFLSAMTMMGLFASTLSSLDSIFLTDFMRVIVSLD